MSTSSLCFIIYGFGRGLQITEGPINEMIRSASKNNKVQVHYFINNQTHIDNIRTNEKGVMPLVPENIFNGAIKSIKNPELGSLENILNKLKQFHDSHNDSFKSYQNLLIQLRLLKSAANEINLNNFDYVICFRDDIYFKNPRLNWKKIFKALDNQHIFTTCYGWNNGVSDRFFISNPAVASIILNRIDKVEEYAEKYKSITGEQLIFYIVNLYKISVSCSKIIFSRVRFDGIVRKERHLIPFWRPKELLRILKGMYEFYF